MAGTLDPWTPLADDDHGRLAALIEDTGRICPASDARDCRDCAAERHAACRDTIGDCGHRLMELLLRHLADEEKLLAVLPRTVAAWNHRARHRRHHHEFIAGYNRFVMGLRHGTAADHAPKLEALVASWTRDHVLPYEAELAALLAGE